jgi:hypothetical protein
MENLIIPVTLMGGGIKNITVQPLFLNYKKLKSRLFYIQLKPILDIFLRGFSLSSYPQHSTKVLLFESLLRLNPTCLLKHVLKCEQNFVIFHISIRINCNRIGEGLLKYYRREERNEHKRQEKGDITTRMITEKRGNKKKGR